MVSKTQRQSSRSYKQRQALAQSHFGRTPQIYKKEMPKIRRSMNTTTNKSLSIWARLADWFKKLIGR